MASIVHAVELLASPTAVEPRPVCVAFGDEAFLKQHVLRHLRAAVLHGDDGDFSHTVFEGATAQYSEVLEELSTVAMFGGGQRFVVLRQADDFVTLYRQELEAYVARPRRTGVLAIDVKTWPKNTRLYKAVLETGLTIDCACPTGAKLAQWVVAWARQSHDLRLDAAGADRLVEMVGPELGLIDQELAKLALLLPPGGKVPVQQIEKLVGSWRARSTWDMLDTALAGRAAEALAQLDRLLLAGETPIGILAQVAFSLRRLAAATRLILAAEQAGQRLPVEKALEQAGEKPFALKKAKSQLIELGRHRGRLLLGWLLQADLDLKGDSHMPPRQILERLIVQLASPALKSAEATRSLRRVGRMAY